LPSFLSFLLSTANMLLTTGVRGGWEKLKKKKKGHSTRCAHEFTGPLLSFFFPSAAQGGERGPEKRERGWRLLNFPFIYSKDCVRRRGKEKGKGGGGVRRRWPSSHRLMFFAYMNWKGGRRVTKGRKRAPSDLEVGQDLAGWKCNERGGEKKAEKKGGRGGGEE